MIDPDAKNNLSLRNQRDPCPIAKSSGALLKAMAEKLIPGIPHASRIAILQQTDVESRDDGVEDARTGASGSEGNNKGRTVLEYAMGSDKSAKDIVRKATILAKSFDTDDPLEPVRAIRKIRHEKLEEQLFLAQKNSNLKSGARGFQARKDLKAAESKLEVSRKLVEQDREMIDVAAIKDDTQSAIDTLEELQSIIEAIKIRDVEQHARHILKGLGFKEAAFNKPFKTLSGGWRMRCALASVLIQESDIMILDEPTNFLDLLGVVWLENYLHQLRDSSETTVVVVSHDRAFMNAVSEEIVILRDQQLTYFRGNLTAYEQDFDEQKLRWGRMKETQERQIAHMEATIRETTKAGKKTNDENKLRMAKSRQKKVDDRMGIQVSAKGGRFKLNRDLPGFHLSSRAEIEVPTDEKASIILLPEASELRFPGPLISLEGVHFRYKPTEALVLNGVELVVHLGDRVGIVGLNGSGKSTLLQIVTGKLLPSKGKISTHSRLKFGYYSQHAVEELQEQGKTEPELTALGLMAREIEGALNEGATRGLLSSLGLAGRIASDVPISRLSGGQLRSLVQVRLALARIVWNSPHLLILDEITTHLDFYTVTALATAMSSFNGAILLVSHDRFLVQSVIEGKRDLEHKLDKDFEGVDEEMDDVQSRKRETYVIAGGKLHQQKNGVEEFERSLMKRVRKTLSTDH
ncbi:hypothetical protein MPDQ_005592 [Monascus purpureus]|uniref:ABC transporter domain-containing protein n=1 Tax=Monascus purpureus TaxID=5098 RepID=A0A507R5S8_MONPU|nr:hypothetical protein MPDQ_005592 [Monascus purpureus]